MQNHITPLASQPEQRNPGEMGSLALLKLLIARHPYATTVFFFVYWVALPLALSRLLAPVATFFRTAHLSFLLYELLAEALLALIVVFPVLVLKWGSETGFARGINGRGLVICLIPILLIAGPAALALLFGNMGASGLIVTYAVILSLLVGIAEEGMFRGLIIRSLLPKGIWPTVLISSVLFASMHLLNLLSGASWGYVAGQLILAFGVGVLFAALRLRTGSIWPGIILHASRDVAGLILIGVDPSFLSATPSSSAYVVNMIFCFCFLLNAFILLRPGQKRKLEIAYGLARQPEIASPGYQPQPYAGAQYSQGYPPYPMYGGQPPATEPPANLPPPHPGAVSYQEYTSPAAYGEQPPPEATARPTPHDGEE